MRIVCDLCGWEAVHPQFYEIDAPCPLACSGRLCILVKKRGWELGYVKNPVIVKFKIMHLDAVAPKRMSAGASGWDLYACETVSCIGIGPVCIRTGIAIEMPEGYEAQIRPRSNVPIRRHLLISNSPGTIDSDYHDEILVPVHNFNTEPNWAVQKGERIAQLVICRVPEVEFEEVEELSETERDAGGFV